jgi:hypothetical protein
VFGHGSFVWMLQTDVPVYPGLSGMPGLPNVDLTTFAGHTVRAWSLKSQEVLHRPKETGNFPRGEAHRQQPADAIEGRTLGRPGSPLSPG